MSYSVDFVRRSFPALSRMHRGMPAVYFDGPGGSQVCQPVIEAITQYMIQGGANLHGAFPTSLETEKVIADARQSVADLLGVDADEVAFGANMTSLNFTIARALAKTWTAGDEIVLTELDHRANVDPWRLAAEERGVHVRFLSVNPETLTLELDTLDSIIHERTKLVAIGLASNAVGTVTDVRTIASKAHQVGALVAVDAVHAVPHLSVDRDELDADILLCSAYKFFGPHIGIAAIRRRVFEALDVYKLAPAPTNIPDKLETGTQNHSGLAGVYATVEFISSLGEGVTSRERLKHAMTQIEEHEEALASRLRRAIEEIPGIRLYSAATDVRKTPTIAFRHETMQPREICQRMVDDYAIFVADGDFYASTLAEKLGIRERGGFVRAGLAPYTTVGEVDLFLEALQQICR